MAVSIRSFDLEDCRAVAWNMRSEDWREIYATIWDHETPDNIAQACEMVKDFSRIAYLDGCPVAVFGGFPLRPGVWSLYMFATDSFRQVSLSVTRWCKAVILTAFHQFGAHRAECHSIEGHEQAHRWLEVLGAERESASPGFGKGGETFYRYVWRRNSVLS